MNHTSSGTSQLAAANTIIVILCTVPDRKLADSISTALVEKRLAACVNILPGLSSVYRWKNQIERSEELLLIIKSAMVRFDEIVNFIRSAHPYELPEILVLPISGGVMEYLDWIIAETSAQPH